MFLLRRTAARAVASAPSAVFVKPRSITTISPAFRLQQQRWIAPSSQRRFVSDEAAKSETFAQTAAEAPVEENLTPAKEAPNAEPVDSSATTSRDQPSRPSTLTITPPVPNRTVYVGNLFYQVTAEQLQRVFSRFGKIDDVRIIYDNRGLSRGFGYVEFANVDDARAAIENLDMQVFEGRNLVVQFHRNKEGRGARDGQGNFREGAPSKTLFIGNMSYEMSDKDLNDLFRNIRNVVDVRVAIDRRTGQPRGFAHADFLDVASATAAKAELSNKVIYGRALRIDFSKSVSRRDRDENREEQVEESNA